MKANPTKISLMSFYREKSGSSGGGGGDYFLYIQAKSESERDEWLALLRNLVRHNSNLSEKYHSSQWSAGRWLCCGQQSKRGGCKPITWNPRQGLVLDNILRNKVNELFKITVMSEV